MSDKSQKQTKHKEIRDKFHPGRYFANYKTKRFWVGVFYLLAGSLLSAFALNIFFVPTMFTMGGVSGMASIIYQLTGQGDFLNFGTLVIILNIPLLILGLVKIGFSFVWRSIVGTFVYSLVLDLARPFTEGWFEQYLDIRMQSGNRPDPLIFALFGGILFGISMGLILRGGYTTGGTDVLAVVLHRRWPNLTIGNLLMMLDVLIVISTLFFYRDEGKHAILLAMYSFIAMWFTARFTDITISGLDFSRAVYIISEHKEEISQQVFKDLDRSVTLLPAKGMYTGKERDLLYCVVSSRQVPKLKAIVKDIDPRAFVVVHEVNEVVGEGFERDSADFLA
ncbi:MAG: YitT family protein [Eubacteriales bacterium]|nr:YitT family protein [Eubacteriales bacterium]